MSEKLIVALDYPDLASALKLVDELDELVTFFKVGWELYLTSNGAAIPCLQARRKHVFLDLKLDDIPETVRRTVAHIPLGIDFFTIQGDFETYKAAKEGRRQHYPKFLYVPMLSSRLGKAAYDLETRKEVEKMIEYGCDGFVASGEMVGLLRRYFAQENFLIVTPGVRLKDEEHDDHQSCLTPSQAIKNGADYIVMGRSIKNSENPRRAVQKIIQEMGET